MSVFTDDSNGTLQKRVTKLENKVQLLIRQVGELREQRRKTNQSKPSNVASPDLSTDDDSCTIS